MINNRTAYQLIQKEKFMVTAGVGAVSYTHLDVYKRQMYNESDSTHYISLLFVNLFTTKRINVYPS